MSRHAEFLDKFIQSYGFKWLLKLRRTLIIEEDAGYTAPGVYLQSHFPQMRTCYAG